MTTTDELFSQILSEAPSSETILLLLKRWKEEGRINSVIREGIKALGRHPGDIRVRALLAETCFESGWLSRAESEAETAAGQVEELIGVYKLKAKIYARLNRREEAVRFLQIFLVHRPDDEESLHLLQELTPIPESPPAPVRAVEEVPVVNPLPAAVPEIATPTLAEVYFAQGQMEEAIATYEKVLAQNPAAEQSRTRLDELKRMIDPVPPAHETGPAEEPPRKKTQKLIHVLEAWKEAIVQDSRQ
jgi:tetratricopeptide (TPR) repeat protein